MLPENNTPEVKREEVDRPAFRAALEASPAGKLLINQKGEILFASTRLADMFGYNKQELVGKSVEILVPKQFHENHPRYRADYFADPQARAMGAGRDLFGIKKDGSEFPVEIGLNPIVTDKEVLVLAAVADITQRKRQEERFKIALDASPTGMVMIGERGKMVLVNQKAEELFGYKREELIGQSIEILVPERFRPTHSDYRKGFFANPQVRPMGAGRDLFGLRKDGTEFPVEIGLNPLTMEEGTFVISSIIDITERKRAEEELAEKRNKLEKMVEELQHFSYVASHDLKEPLRVVSSYTQLLEKRYKGQLDSNADQYIQFITGNVKRMYELINDLLNYSKLGIAQKPMQRSNCASIFDQAVANLQTAIKESGAEVTKNSLPEVTGDPILLVELFQNLIGNGIKFHGTEKPQVTVSAEQKDHEWLFSVRDNGIGIEPQYKDRIFEMFQRLHRREEYPGTGIGLSICKKIVELHKGRIWVESELGKGSSFCFTIPK